MQYHDWLMLGCTGRMHIAPAAVFSAETFMSDLEVALRHCLNLRARRWASYEFMTAAIDETWFQQGTMQDLLRQLGLHRVRFIINLDRSSGYLFPRGLL
jgi:hypothetical protein